MRKTSLIGTGTCTERFSVFWTFAWRAILCYIGLTYFSVVTESTLLGPMKFPEMWQQGHYIRWTAMMLVGAFITYVSPIFAARWLLRRKYLRRTTWLDTARLWWAFTWRRKPLQPANFHPVTERSAGAAALKRRPSAADHHNGSQVGRGRRLGCRHHTSAVHRDRVQPACLVQTLRRHGTNR